MCFNVLDKFINALHHIIASSTCLRKQNSTRSEAFGKGGYDGKHRIHHIKYIIKLTITDILVSDRGHHVRTIWSCVLPYYDAKFKYRF